MRRAFFFILAVLFANASFASIPRASLLDDAPAIETPSTETRVWASDVLAPFERQAESELTRALRQAYEQAGTTNASGLGRFLSVDPVLDAQSALHNPQTWNRYSYVRNNPIGYVDPDGRAAQAAVGLIAQGAAVGAVEGAAIQMVFNYILDQPLMQDVGREAAIGAGIGAATLGAGVLLRGAYDGFRITRAVRTALNSADHTIRAEGKVAAALGRSVVAFRRSSRTI